ncbi:MAG: D-glycero-beta-D-manno-heptose 1-phosphate adenylyltransferase [Planctomycetota bacterium]
MSLGQLIELMDRWRRPNVLVVGDLMLDRYAFGNADRLSPDAPVPVLAVESERHAPGGAANVALDLLALRCDVAIAGVIGGDASGSILKHALDDAGADTTALAVDRDRPTTVKHNLIGLAQHRHPQKMFRMDVESRQPLPAAVRADLIAKACGKIASVDAVVVEDYGKGVLCPDVCRAVIDAAKAAGKPVFVDPAAITDYAKYAGASCITPNRTEAYRAAGPEHAQSEPVEVARWLRQTHGFDHVVLTLDKSGALLLGPDDAPETIPTRAREVYDVTGAGDMVVAALTAARANAAPWPQAVELANLAAGLEVERPGVTPIPFDELLAALLDESRGERGKVRLVDELLPELSAHRSAGRSIVFTNGCFDLLHAGHVQYLRAAKAQGDKLIVGLNTDDSIRRLKGEGRPVNHLDDRLLVLSELESIDYLVPFDEDTPIELIRKVKPDVLVKGADYTLDTVVGRDVVEAQGGRVELINLVEGRSTTGLIERMRAMA